MSCVMLEVRLDDDDNISFWPEKKGICENTIRAYGPLNACAQELWFLAVEMTLSARTNTLHLPEPAMEPENRKSIRRQSQPA